MKKSILMSVISRITFLAILTCPVIISANEKRWVAQNAQNILQEKDPYATESSFIIDGNQSKGYVILIFDDVTLPVSHVPNATLQVRISDHIDAESRTGFFVFLDGRKIGQSGSVQRGTSVSIPLILPQRLNGRYELILRASGTDGVFIQSHISSYAPILKNLLSVKPSLSGKIIKVHKDNNYLESTDDHASQSDFVIDGNQSKGRVSLYFEDIDLLGVQINKPVLKVRISDLVDSESNTGFIVKLKHREVGRSGNVQRNQTINIPLNFNSSEVNGSITLTLVAAGTDGVYIKSKASGMGPELLFNAQSGMSSNKIILKSREVENILRHPDKFADENSLIIDGDQSRGNIGVIFEKAKLHDRIITSAFLRLKISDHQDAESRNGLLVFQHNQLGRELAGHIQIGESGSVQRNSRIDIPLKLPLIPDKSGFYVFYLRAAGNDGLYIQSKLTGLGPELHIELAE